MSVLIQLASESVNNTLTIKLKGRSSHSKSVWSLPAPIVKPARFIPALTKKFCRFLFQTEVSLLQLTHPVLHSVPMPDRSLTRSLRRCACAPLQTGPSCHDLRSVPVTAVCRSFTVSQAAYGVHTRVFRMSTHLQISPRYLQLLYTTCS